MTRTCSVPGCRTKGKKIFHSYPKNEITCSKWIVATKCFFLQKETAYKKQNKVCRHHFRQNDLKGSFNKLKKGAIPSLFLPPAVTLVTQHNYCLDDSIVMNVQSQSNAYDSNDTDSKVICVDGIAVWNISEDLELVEQGEQETIEPQRKQENLNTVTIEDIDEEQETVTPPKKQENMNTATIENIVEESIQLDIQPDNQDKPKISRKYDPVARKIKYQSTRMTFLKRRLRELEKPIESTVFKYISTKLKEYQLEFVKMQIRNGRRKPKGRRFTFEDKCMSVAIYKQNPKGYRFLASFLDLPSKVTLNKHKAQVRFEAGINPILMTFIKETVANKNDLDRYVSVVWDEMALKSHLDFEEIKNYIDGFVDTGNRRTENFATHALVFMVRGIKSDFKQPIAYFLTDNISSEELAHLIKLVIEEISKTGLKVMSSACDCTTVNEAAVNKLIDPGCRRGLRSGRLLEYQINDCKIIHIFDTPHILKSLRNNLWNKDLIHYVSVKKVDGLGNIQYNIKKLEAQANLKEEKVNLKEGVKMYVPIKTLSKMNLRKRKTKLIEKIDTRGKAKIQKTSKVNRKVSARGIRAQKNVNDPVNSIDSPKNNTQKTASWTDIRDFYDYDNKGVFRLLSKITDEHMSPLKKKMKVKLATQVLNGTYGRNMFFCSERSQLGRDFTGTASILLFFNDLFDSLNGSGKVNGLKGCVCPSSTHFEFWDYAIEMLTKMKFGPNKETNKPNQSNVLQHFISTIKGVQEICRRAFNLGFETISLRRFNQDVLENFFGCIRSYCQAATKPTTRNFRCAYVTSIFNNLSSKQSIKTNCERDNAKPLLCNIYTMFTSSKNTSPEASDVPLDDNCDDHCDDDCDDSSENTMLESESLQCSEMDLDFTMNDALNHVTGEIYKKLLQKIKCEICRKYVQESDMITNHDILLTHPSNKFISHTNRLLIKLEQFIPMYCLEKNITEKILSEIDTKKIGCPEHQIELTYEVEKLSTFFVIFNYVKHVNWILDGKTKSITNNDPIQEAALRFRTKKKFIGKFSDIIKHN